MSTIEFDFLVAVEIHSVERLQKLLDEGLDPHALIKGKSLVTSLTEMYYRSDRFADCLRLLLSRGALLDDPLIAPVLLDDADMLIESIKQNPSLINHRTNMVSTFSPLIGATLLHVAAEYGQQNAARALISLGADVNAKTDVDEYGLNGQTPIFHTVNSNGNRSEPIMRMLLEAGARVDIQLPGIVWGKGFEWETTFFDVTPISYAHMGCLPQVHRSERDIFKNIQHLLKCSGRPVPPLDNVPNRYLNPSSTSE